jgi:hypothetical protein
MPVFVFHGLYFLLWLTTFVVFIILCLALVVDDLREKYKEAYENKAKMPSWYYTMDHIFDILALFIMAGLGFYAYAVLYFFCIAVAYIVQSDMD